MSWDTPKVKVSNKLQSFLALLCATLLLAPPLQARNRQGDKFLRLGQKAEAASDYDTALKYYDQALATESDDPTYMIPDQRIRTKVAQVHLAQGRTLQQQQRLDEALVQFQKAFVADPSSQIVFQELRQTTEMIKERSRVAAGTPILTPAERARQEMERRINSLQGPPTLRPINSQISSIKMNNQPARVLYETVAKLAGINVLLDPQGIETVQGKNFNLDLNNVTLEEALNYIALETHTFWKPISRNAIFISQETDQKRQEYQDEVVKVFYIQNASTQNEFTEIFNGIRTVAKLTTGVFSIPSQNAVVARGSADTISLVEKLVHELDRPKAEVIIDVVVMQVNKTVATTIGASVFGQGGLGGSGGIPVNFTPRTPTTTTSTTTTSSSGSTSAGSAPVTSTPVTSGSTTSTSSQFTLARLGHVSSADFSTTLPSTVVNALMNDSRSHVLQRPQVRATDGGKASLKIGQKIPYVSGSLNSAVATPGSVPYATTQFQQIDVGTQIDLQPHVNGSEEISMHIKVEVSNVVQWLSIAGVSEPEIGQQVDEADIRMRDGEVSILGGLSDKEYSLGTSGFPGLTNIPLLGYIFGQKNRSTTDSEVLVAMIPHIIRAPDMSGMGQDGVLAGTERVVRVERKSDGATGSVTSPAPGAAMPAPAQPQPQPAPPTINAPAYPRITQPAPSQPPPSQPGPTEPAQIGPAATDSSATDSSATQPAGAQPAPGQPTPLPGVRPPQPGSPPQ